MAMDEVVWLRNQLSKLIDEHFITTDALVREGNNDVDAMQPIVDAIKTGLDGANTDIDELVSRLTSTRAGYIDYLANSTYGLSAIRTLVNSLKTGGTVPIIKSVQSGFSTFSWSYGAQGAGYSATKTTDITISSVNKAKAFVVAFFPFGMYAQPVGGGAALTSNTTLRITAQTATHSGSCQVGWQVIEFY